LVSDEVWGGFYSGVGDTHFGAGCGLYWDSVQAMIPAVEVGEARIFLGDCREILRGLADNSVDSVVTDPPYELGFMGKKWDSTGIAYDVTVWEECLRVLKPGGHVLAFGGSRTFHRMAVAIEDAGFEIRDSIAWMYGSGFPKSLDVSKAIDKAAGAERDSVIEKSADIFGEHENPKIVTRTGKQSGTYGAMTGISPQTVAATSEAQQREGWGTALKPAFEPIVVGRKPFGKGSTVAANVLEWGVGGLNIDASRIGTETRVNSASKSLGNDRTMSGGTANPNYPDVTVQGRWPANVILDEYSAGLLDEQSGVLTSGALKPWVNGSVASKTVASFSAGLDGKTRDYTADKSSGGAFRFFYCAKASKRDRNEGLDGLADTSAGEMVDRVEDSAGMNSPRAGAGRTSGAKNFHPTVKPTALMRYLIKLVTPAGGTVLDPFTGSGSTGKAALLDGYKFVGAELTEEYLPIIEGRLTWAQENTDTGTLF
jgi:site-specific DNA-methyltransferase (adenine-specific)